MTSEDFLRRPNDVPTKNFCVHFFQQSTPPNSNCIITNTKIFFPIFKWRSSFFLFVKRFVVLYFHSSDMLSGYSCTQHFCVDFYGNATYLEKQGKKQFSDMHKCRSPYRGPQQVIGVQLIRKWNIIFFDKNWTCFLVQKMTLIFFQFQTYFRNSGHKLF